MQRQPTENPWSLLAKRNETHPSTRHASDIRPLAGDLRHASGAGRNGEPEAVQFGDGRDEAEAKTQPRVAAAFIGTVEASRDEIAFGGSDARSIVADTHDAFVAHASKAHLDAAAFGGEFHRIVDEIGNGLEQEVTVAPHDHVLLHSDRESDSLVLGNGLVELADLAQEIRQRHLAEGGCARFR